MKEYHKIQSIFKRDEKTHKFLMGVFSRDEFSYLANNQWVFTEKVDGTNIRVGWDGTTVSIGGKTDNAQLHVELLTNLQAMFPASKFESLYPTLPMTLYGEGYGAGIQKGGCYRPDKSFVMFDVCIEGIWLHRESVQDIASKLSIDVVPIIGEGTLTEAIRKTREGFKSQWGDFIAEGIVARPSVELLDRRGHRIITKVKHKDF